MRNDFQYWGQMASGAGAAMKSNLQRGGGGTPDCPLW